MSEQNSENTDEEEEQDQGTGPEPTKYGLGHRLLATLSVLAITLSVLWALFDAVVVSINPFTTVIFWASPLIAGYIAYRWGWQNKYFISK